MFQILYRTILIAAFAVWFGGFTFYTAVVVPIGTDVLSSSRTQGFVTQQVTNTLNVIGIVTVLLMIVDVAIQFKKRTKRSNLFVILNVATILGLLLLLLIVHPILDGMLEPEHEHVNDDARFYQVHRIYLWGSTIQWVFCWAWLVFIIRDWTPTQKQS